MTDDVKAALDRWRKGPCTRPVSDAFILAVGYVAEHPAESPVVTEDDFAVWDHTRTNNFTNYVGENGVMVWAILKPDGWHVGISEDLWRVNPTQHQLRRLLAALRGE